jgi:hypothetical protein
MCDAIHLVRASPILMAGCTMVVIEDPLYKNKTDRGMGRGDSGRNCDASAVGAKDD